MDVPSLKAQIRRERLSLRDAIDHPLRLAFSDRMADFGAAAIDCDMGTAVAGFFPIRSEADIRPLMLRLAQRGARLCLPVVQNRENITFRLWNPEAPLVDTGFGTRGPGPDSPEIDPELLLVPLSAFDASGNRIGYGAGYYDRAIARLRAKGIAVRLIGIAFDCQEVAEVPAEPHDIRLEAVLTETGLRQFRM